MEAVLRLFVPDVYVPSIYAVNAEALVRKGLLGVVTDLDNTLVAWNEPQAPDKLVHWLDDLRDRGLKVCIVSNNKEVRVRPFAEQLNIPALYEAGKPRMRAFMKALEITGTHPRQTAMIGDQLFTDIAGGNRMGMYTILVVPISDKEWVGTRVMRLVERRVLRFIAPSLHRISEGEHQG
ncbi:YqeG family HAD IIIA-type phosphatase [Kyrpidia spormannii]|uniref:YqeG family HAD IIIA-type phosphatase n=1 Tax=Kyrpidia spormannii TaxID=2055160 RepID=A0A2K8N799_9BACL|nr:YqeG family HAD IIIA-type phosphatase [Kyrpidia spormannii]MCL6575860.1 YqeG family HAD IIIA-type phosphatase [Kyrpidia sp.]HHY66169.1 YqeG family HAD IIIA-type phosphatase [Alicyclobacillus sp.]